MSNDFQAQRATNGFAQERTSFAQEGTDFAQERIREHTLATTLSDDLLREPFCGTDLVSKAIRRDTKNSFPLKPLK